MGIFQKGMNPGAYQGNLNCPFCSSRAIRFIENIGPFRLRYRCRKCGLPFQYETGKDMRTNPYAAFKKNKWQELVKGEVTPMQFLRGRK